MLLTCIFRLRQAARSTLPDNLGQGVPVFATFCTWHIKQLATELLNEKHRFCMPNEANESLDDRWQHGLGPVTTRIKAADMNLQSLNDLMQVFWITELNRLVSASHLAGNAFNVFLADGVAILA